MASLGQAPHADEQPLHADAADGQLHTADARPVQEPMMAAEAFIIKASITRYYINCDLLGDSFIMGTRDCPGTVPELSRDCPGEPQHVQDARGAPPLAAAATAIEALAPVVPSINNSGAEHQQWLRWCRAAAAALSPLAAAVPLASAAAL